MNTDERRQNPTADEAPITSATERPLVEAAPDLAAPDPLEQVRPVAACLPNDADDTSDTGSETTDHEDAGWRANRLAKP